MKTILAIDLSTKNIGVSIYHSVKEVFELSHAEQISLGGKTMEERMQSLNEVISTFIHLWNPTEIATERPTAFGHGIAVAYAIGVIYRLAGLHKISVTLVSPNTVKKDFSGSGRANKVEMIAHYNKVTGRSAKIKDADMVDSIAIGYSYITKTYNADICLK